MEEREKARRGGLVGPIILVGGGTVLLLNNLGVVPWSVWSVLLRAWPALLIAIGVDLLIPRRSVWASLLVLVLIVAVLAGGYWLSWASAERFETAVGERISEELGGATRAVLSVQPGAGSLEVSALTRSNNFVEGEIRLLQGQTLDRTYRVAGGTARLSLSTTGLQIFVPLGNRRGEWDLGVTSAVPLDAEFRMGVGQMILDLSELQVSDLVVDMGVGRTVVTLPAKGRVSGSIKGAIGDTIIEVPRGMEVRLRVDSGLTGTEIPASYRQRDDVYTSPGYDTADNRADLEVGQAIGRLRIVAVSP